MCLYKLVYYLDEEQMKKKCLYLSLLTIAMIFTSSYDANANHSDLKRINSLIELPQSQSDETSSGEQNTHPEAIYNLLLHKLLSSQIQTDIDTYKKNLTTSIKETKQHRAKQILALGKKLGFKKATLNSKHMYVVDISWDSMKEYASNILKNSQGSIEENRDLKRLKTALSLVENISYKSDDRRFTNISDEQKDKIVDFCLSEDGIFEVATNLKDEQEKLREQADTSTELIQELTAQIAEATKKADTSTKRIQELTAQIAELTRQAKKLLAETLKNYTGFQRIASLLILNILNNIEQYKITDITKKISINAGNAAFNRILMTIFVPLDFTDAQITETSISFIHEVGHAYHHLLMNYDTTEYTIHTPLETFSIINSQAADFTTLFYPALSTQNFKNTVDNLAPIIKNIVDFDSIKKDINNNASFRLRSSDIIVKLFGRLILAGFGNKIFDTLSPDNIDSISIDDIFNENTIAKAIYIASMYIRKGLIDNTYQYSKEGQNFIFDEDELAESIWDGPTEMLTMIGIVPYLLNGETFAIIDKQNEFIAKKRTIASGDSSNEQNLGVFRHHEVGRESKKGLYTILKAITKDPKLLDGIDPETLAQKNQDSLNAKDQDIKATVSEHFEKIQYPNYPANLMHVEYPTLTLEKSDAIQTIATEILANITGPIEDKTIVTDASNDISKPISSQNKESIDSSTPDTNATSNANLAKPLNAPPTKKDEELIEAVEDDDTAKVNELLQNHQDVNVNISDPEPLLCIAVQNNNTDIVKALLEHKDINVNIQDSMQVTPLHIAIQKGNIDIVKALLAHKYINVNIQTTMGLTPLHIAIQNGNIDIVKALLEHKDINVNIQTTMGLTPLHFAIRKGNIDIVKALLEHKDINVNIQTTMGLTPLHFAIRKGKIEIVNALLEHKDIDVNIQTIIVSPPLHFAIQKGNIEIIKTLLARKDIDVNLESYTNMTPLYMAVQNNNFEIAKLLVNKDATNSKVNDNAQRKRPGDISKYPREFSKLRLLLNPIYECALLATEDEMNNALNEIGIQIPEEKIAALRKKLKGDTPITEDDLNTLQIPIDEQSPKELKKRKSEWNVSGLLYYISVYTKVDEISDVNKRFLYNLLKQYNCIILDEDLSQQYIQWKNNDTIIKSFKKIGIEDIESKTKEKTDKTWENNLLNIFNELKQQQPKFSGKDLIDFVQKRMNALWIDPTKFTDIKQKICINAWNNLGRYIYLINTAQQFKTKQIIAMCIPTPEKLHPMYVGPRISDNLAAYFGITDESEKTDQ